MKRGIVVFMICLFVLCAASVAFAAEARTSGLFTYEIKGNGTAVITDYDWKNHGKEDLYIPNMLDGYTITGIGDNAFQKHVEDTYAYLKDHSIMVKLPESIVSIGEKAFVGCYCIKAINIPASVKIIGAGAFAGGWIICNVDAKNDTFTTIDDVLYNKKDRELMYIPHGSAALSGGDGYLRAPTFVIPEGIESVGGYAFYQIEAKVVVPSTIRYIKDYAFCGAWLDGNIVFPESLESIGKCAFKDASGGATCAYLDFQNTAITTIPESAFESARIYDMPLPKTIRSIGDCAFKNAECQKVAIQEGIESIGISAFEGAYCDREITLPNTLKSIGDKAFANSISLSQITIPTSVNTIGEDVFDRTKVTLVVTPGSYAETWATENGYMIAKQGGDDTSWLNYD